MAGLLTRQRASDGWQMGQIAAEVKGFAERECDRGAAVGGPPAGV